MEVGFSRCLFFLCYERRKKNIEDLFSFRCGKKRLLYEYKIMHLVFPNLLICQVFLLDLLPSQVCPAKLWSEIFRFV